MRHKIELMPDDDRVVTLEVKTNCGTYYVQMEFVAHHFGLPNDDVQVSVRKPTMPPPEDGGPQYGVAGPNALYSGGGAAVPLLISEPEKMNNIGGVWFEFHESHGLPAVHSYDEPTDLEL